MDQRLNASALALMLLGGACLVAGVFLLLLNAVNPQGAAQWIAPTRYPTTPTPGQLLQTPLSIPALPQQAALSIPIMPVMAVATPQQATLAPTLPPTTTAPPQASPTQALPSLTATPPTSPTARQISTPLEEVTLIASLTLTPSPTPQASPIGFITPTPSPTLIPLVPVRIEIPSIELTAPIQPVWLQQVVIDGQTYSQWRVPDGRVVGWHETSARIGQADNLVLNGHHNIEGRVFADLIQVEVGQHILLSAADRSTRQYTVVQTLLMEEEGQPAAQRLQNARWLLPSHDERITLVTCWPPDGRSHRLVVVALPSDFVEQTNP